MLILFLGMNLPAVLSASLPVVQSIQPAYNGEGPGLPTILNPSLNLTIPTITDISSLGDLLHNPIVRCHEQPAMPQRQYRPIVSNNSPAHRSLIAHHFSPSQYTVWRPLQDPHHWTKRAPGPRGLLPNLRLHLSLTRLAIGHHILAR